MSRSEPVGPFTPDEVAELKARHTLEYVRYLVETYGLVDETSDTEGDEDDLLVDETSDTEGDEDDLLGGGEAPEQDPYEGLKVVELQALLAERGLDINGLKAELLARLKEADGTP